MENQTAGAISVLKKYLAAKVRIMFFFRKVIFRQREFESSDILIDDRTAMAR